MTTVDSTALDQALADFKSQVSGALANLDAEVAGKDTLIAQLQAKIDQLEHPAPPPPPPTPASKTVVGATPLAASNDAGVREVYSIFGGPFGLRLFYSGDLAVPPAVSNGTFRVGSCKTDNATSVNNGHLYDRVAFDHEIDSKIKKGQTTLALWQASMKKFQGVPGLSVILTADCFVNKSKNPADYLIPGVKYLGVDFDGISGDTYHDYSKELANVVAFVKAHNLTWGVAEFGANRAPSDTDGSKRAAWLQHWLDQFKAAGAEYVMFWANNSFPGSPFSKPAEIQVVKSSVTH